MGTVQIVDVYYPGCEPCEKCGQVGCKCEKEKTEEGNE